jgi:hypothetical protein
MFFTCLTGHVLMTVQHDFCPERWMSTHLDGDVSPVGIEDMKMIVVDVGSRFLASDVADLTRT